MKPSTTARATSSRDPMRASTSGSRKRGGPSGAADSRAPPAPPSVFLLRLHHIGQSLQRLSHRHQLKPHALFYLVPDALARLVAARGVEPHAGERRHQLDRAEAVLARLALARLEDGRADAAPRPGGVDEEGANLRRLRRRVELPRIASGVTVAAEERPPPAPAAAPDRLAPRLGDVISPVEDQLGVHAEDRRDGRLDLLVRVIAPAQA